MKKTYKSTKEWLSSWQIQFFEKIYGRENSEKIIICHFNIGKYSKRDIWISSK